MLNLQGPRTTPQLYLFLISKDQKGLASSLRVHEPHAETRECVSSQHLHPGRTSKGIHLQCRQWKRRQNTPSRRGRPHTVRTHQTVKVFFGFLLNLGGWILMRGASSFLRSLCSIISL